METLQIKSFQLKAFQVLDFLSNYTYTQFLTQIHFRAGGLDFYLLVSVSGHEVSTKSVRLSYFSSELVLLRARLFDISGQVNEAIGNRANIKRRSISKLADSWSSFKL